jgi:predicted alpha/beta hydrolase family esterase
MAKENPEQVRNILNFDENFAKVDNSNVFPLLSLYDQIIRFERQKQCYDERLITVLEKGHITGSLTFEKLRRHILENLKNYKRGV